MSHPNQPLAEDGLHPSVCRVCQAFCGINVVVSSGQAVKVTGDRENPNSHGYTCAKGRSLPDQLSDPKRLLHAIKRSHSGAEARIPAAEAMAEVAARLSQLVSEHGSRSVAVYYGTGSAGYPAGGELARAFCTALGTPMFFSPSTIDQPGKQVAAALHGRWGAHSRSLSTSDRWVFIGANPVVSMWAGTVLSDPRGAIRRAQGRGTKIMVVDPRRTETAALADLHLRPRPGSDPVLLAGLLREILESESYDHEFCDTHVAGLPDLKAAISTFTPELVAGVTGVSETQLLAAVDFLTSSRRGHVSIGTGPNMAPEGVLSEYLALAIHTICGYWPRAGEQVVSPGVLAPARRWVAAADPPSRAVGGEPMRVRGLTQTAAGMPTAALPDEILLDGPGRIRALLCFGGNPVSAWPDEQRTRAALAKLDLLVCLDVRANETTAYADYVVGTRMHLEVPQMTCNEQSIRAYGATSMSNEGPYAIYARRLVAPPEGSDVVEEWEFLYGVARQMGLRCKIGGTDMDMTSTPTTDEIFALMTRSSRISLATVKAFPHGHVFDDLEPDFVAAPDIVEHRLQVGAPTMIAALHSIADAAPEALLEDDELLLIVRRQLAMKNSFGRHLAAGQLLGVNPLSMHPADMDRLHLTSDEKVEISSNHGAIQTVVKKDETLLPGTASLTHGYGSNQEFNPPGANPNRIIPAHSDYNPITGQPRMSAIRVKVRPVPFGD